MEDIGTSRKWLGVSDVTGDSTFDVSRNCKSNRLLIPPYITFFGLKYDLANQGFVSVTVSSTSGAPDSKELDADVVGTYVNYIIVNSGIEKITTVSTQIKYLEIASPGTEIAWEVPGTPSYTGLMLLSDVNIKLGTTINVTGATYLGADMYVGGTFTNAGWTGYYGDTTGNVGTKYITY